MSKAKDHTFHGPCPELVANHSPSIHSDFIKYTALPESHYPALAQQCDFLVTHFTPDQETLTAFQDESTALQFCGCTLEQLQDSCGYANEESYYAGSENQQEFHGMVRQYAYLTNRYSVYGLVVGATEYESGYQRWYVVSL